MKKYLLYIDNSFKKDILISTFNKKFNNKLYFYLIVLFIN